MNKILIICVVSCLFVLIGCFGPRIDTDSIEPVVSVPDVVKNVDREASNISASTSEIRKKSDNIIEVTYLLSAEATGEKKTISETAKSIKDESEKIDKFNEKIKIESQKMSISGKETSKLIEENAKIRSDLKKSNDKLKDTTYQKMQWLVFFGVISLGVSGALIVSGSKFGIFGAVASAIIISLARAISTFSYIISIAGGAIVLIIVGWLGWYLFVNRKALIECVKSVEVVQENITFDEKEKIFGKPGDNGLMKDVQSRSTENIVKREKQKIKKTK